MSRGELPPGPASQPDSAGQIDRTPDAAAAWQLLANELDAVIERRAEPGSPIDQALRAQSAAADEAPSAALDASIRAAARRAVSAGPRALASGGASEGSAVLAGDAPLGQATRPARSWRQRAALPMAAAAMIVLTVSVTTLIEQERRSVEAGAVLGAPPAPPSASPGAVLNEPAAPPPASPGAVAGVPPAPPSAHSEARTEALPRSLSRAGESAPPSLQTAPVAPAAVAAVPGAAVDASGVAAANQGQALASAPELQNERPGDRPRTALARAQAPVVGSAQPPDHAASVQAANGVARPSASAAEAEQRVGSPTSSAPASSELSGRGEPRAASRASSPLPRSAEVTRQSARDPDKWLAEVLELRRAGREKDAELALVEFRKVWPDYPLPAALKPAR